MFFFIKRKSPFHSRGGNPPISVIFSSGGLNYRHTAWFYAYNYSTIALHASRVSDVRRHLLPDVVSPSFSGTTDSIGRPFVRGIVHVWSDRLRFGKRSSGTLIVRVGEHPGAISAVPFFRGGNYRRICSDENAYSPGDVVDQRGFRERTRRFGD